MYLTKPGRVGGVIPHGRALSSHHFTMIIVSSWYASNNVENLVNLHY